MRRTVLAAALACLAGCAAAPVAPSTILADPASFAHTFVTVRGVAREVRVRGPADLRYRLCDTVCIDVIQLRPGDVKNGRTIVVSGRYHDRGVAGRFAGFTNYLMVRD